MSFTDQFAADPLDPLSALFKFLWVRFDSETDLSAAVKVGNRITFSNGQHTMKENISDGDVPEVMLTFPDITVIGRDSANDQLNVTGRWTVCTGTQQFYNVVTYTTWLLMLMMKRIEMEGSPDLDLPGLVLDKISTPNPVPFGYVDSDLNRGKKGFASNLDFKAELLYNRRSAYDV